MAGTTARVYRGIRRKVKKELRLFAALLYGIVVFIIWYTHSAGYYNSRVLTPTLSSYYLQMQTVKDYRDPEKYITRIDMETLDKKNSATDREITVTIRVRMNKAFENLSEEEADLKLQEIGKVLRKLEQNAREESGLPSAMRKVRSGGKIKLKDELVLLYVTESGEHRFPDK